jgi:hypothetical protein
MYMCGVSKKFGEWSQKTNKTEDTNKVNLFVSSVLFGFWYHSPNFLDTPHMYIYGPTFGNAESRLFLFAAQCFNTESMQKVYRNYRWDLIRYVKG